ncbi:hypothetical protein R5R35_004004 [Gryllus longicercus]|uniref:Integral membrane protein DGCR2/IDD n=1 Tax=Gryllus longicercus TaxID=2509291 RepID=A0AAN9VEH4_9ORTH
MKSKILVFGVTYSLTISATFAAGECTDLHGRTIAPGLHYVPGPDTCTLCVCESGHPKWCKAVLCSPPQDCKSFRLGNSCCEFICLDDTLHKNNHPNNTVMDTSTDLGLRLIASAVTAILSLSLLFFLIHRLRQRKIRGRQNRQLSEDERSLGSIGYIAGSLAYLPGSMGYLGSGNQDHHLEFHYEEPPAHYPLWKPPGNYFPRGEAPPPYEEAVAAARAEAALAAVVSTTSSGAHGGVAGGNGSVATTGTSTHIGSGSGHRTIPINLATSGNFRLEPSSATLGREPRSVDLEPRTRNVEVTVNPSPNSESRRLSRMMDIPAPLSMTSEEINTVSAIRSDAFYEDVLVGPPSSLSAVECYNPNITTTVPGKAKTSSTVLNGPASSSVSNETPLPAPIVEGAIAILSNDVESSSRRKSSQLNDLNKGSLDSGTCSCSYQCLPPPLPPDDNDDYRSECENCKSTHGSRYYLEEEPGITSPQETMTLHRRPQDYENEEQGYYRTSLTLPTHTRRSRTTPLHGTPGASHSARENWFSSMPASSTSSTSSEEE